MMNYNHLYYFYVTVQAGSVTQAAQKLRTSQPSLSVQLKALEDSFGRPLLMRGGRKLVPTTEGWSVYGLARQMFDLADELKNISSSGAPGEIQRIKIGISKSIDPSFVTEVVSHWIKKEKKENQIKVSLQSSDHDQILESLRRQELDFLLTSIPTFETEFEILSAIALPVLLVVPASSENRADWHQLQNGAELFQNLRQGVKAAKWGWVAPTKNFKLRADTERLLERKGIPDRIVFEADVLDSVVRSIVDGVGMAFLPKAYASREIQNRAVRALGPREGFWKHRIWLIGRKSKRKNDQALKFRKAFEKVGAEISV